MGSGSDIGDSARFRHVAVLHGAALGDLILSLSILAGLGRRFPEASISLIARRDFAVVVEPAGVFSGTHDIGGPGFHTLFAESGAVAGAWETSLGGFDLIVNLMSDDGSVLHRRLSELAGRVVSIDIAAGVGDRRHVTAQWRERLGAKGLDLAPMEPVRVTLSSSSRLAGRAKLQRFSPTAARPIVIVHPGAGGAEKCWPVHHFENLAMALGAESIQPMFLIGPVERERFGGEVIASLADRAPILEISDLAELGRIVGAADAYVGNDAGVTHLAALYGAVTTVIFGPTDSAVWSPLGSNVTVLEAGADFDGLDVPQVGAAVLRSLVEPPMSA
jgi:hypothetical protein